MWKVIAILGVALGSVIALGAAADGDPRPPMHRGGEAPVEHIERHATMTEQMRSMTPGGMSSQMADDPMWRMMRDPAHIRAEEQYQRGLDRMLARPDR